MMTFSAVVGMLLFACAGRGGAADPIRHVFLAVDESRHQVLYVNQFDPSKDWAIKGPFRDIQLIGGNKLLISSGDGYREYDMETRKLLKEVKGFPGVESVRRLADGKTLLACNQDGVTIRELDARDKEIRHASFKTGGATRLMRVTPQGTVLFGTFFTDNKTIEGNLDGQVIHSFAASPTSGAYHVLRKPNGHLLLSNGYDAAVVELDSNFKAVKTLGGKASPDAKPLGFNFFGGMQVLKNGDIVVANWTGHGAKDSAKGTQILQFNPEGKVVWKWHDPDRAGSTHGVIILDDLDPKVLNDDVSSVLGAVRTGGQ
jgi:hypothetical protein